MRAQPRARRALSPGVFAALRPFFRYSTTRDAYVLRGVGGRFGPVLTIRREL